MELQDFLRLMVEQDASDLYFLAGAPASLKINGTISHLNDKKLSTDLIQKLAHGIMTEEQIKEFAEFPELNMSFFEEDLGRFRVNVYQQRNHMAMVFRNIKTDIPDLDDLGLPEILKNLIMKKGGLLLFVGATGVGKSTSLASMIDYRNRNIPGHIITIEDPIEFMHTHKKSLVTQREVRIDTDSYSDALKNTLRQAPDVILIGEIRARETMEHAIAFSETGHLCLSTLHANNANQALERIIHFFPENARQQIQLDLSLNLVAIVSQRLVHTVDNQRTAVFEILLGSPLIKDLIKRNETCELKEVMQKSEHIGMQTFDTALLRKYEEGIITLEEALHHADSQNNLRLAIQLKNKGQGDQTTGLSIVQNDDEEEEKQNGTFIDRRSNGVGE